MNTIVPKPAELIGLTMRGMYCPYRGMLHEYRSWLNGDLGGLPEYEDPMPWEPIGS